jgi:hypothetical protein
VAAPAKIFPATRKFPGEGQVVGRAEKPVLPLPIPNGIFFPHPTSAVWSTLPSTTTTVVVSSPLPVISSLTLPTQTTTTATLAVTPSLVVTSPLFCRDEVLMDSDVEEDKLLKTCGH